MVVGGEQTQVLQSNARRLYPQDFDVLGQHTDVGGAGGGSANSPDGTTVVSERRTSETVKPRMLDAQGPGTTDELSNRVMQSSPNLDLLDFDCYNDSIQRPELVEQNEPSSQPDGPMVDMTPSTPVTVPPRRRRGKRATRKLDKTFANMSGLRDEVHARREEVRKEYDDLGFSVEDMQRSQADLMDAFRARYQTDPGEQNQESIEQLWSLVQRHHSSFETRLERVQQLSDHVVEPEARLIVADEDFMAAAKKAVSAIEKSSKAALQASLEATPKDASRERQEEQEQVSLLEKLRLRRADVTMYRERMNELNREQHEEQGQRDFLKDRDDAPPVSDEEFIQSYNNAREDIENDLGRAYADITDLEEACRKANLDPDDDVAELESPASSEILENQFTNGGEDTPMYLDPYTPENHSTPKGQAGRARALSEISVAGSEATTASHTGVHIYNWMDRMEDEKGRSTVENKQKTSEAEHDTSRGRSASDGGRRGSRTAGQAECRKHLGRDKRSLSWSTMGDVQDSRSVPSYDMGAASNRYGRPLLHKIGSIGSYL